MMFDLFISFYRHSVTGSSLDASRVCMHCSQQFQNGRWNLEELVSVAEAARRLGGISKWTVHAWLSQGKLQRTKVGGRTMIRESELQKVIQDGGKSPAPNREKFPQ
jgi:excisionase family DNA binding protein